MFFCRYLSEQAFDFLERSFDGLDKSSFKASNGYHLYGGSRWNNEWRPDSLYMSHVSFRGKRVNLQTLFPLSSAKITSKQIADLRFALTELAAAVTKPPVKDEEDLSNMESFGSTL
jgi:hypothetical protein